jgi:protein AbiQ
VNLSFYRVHPDYCDFLRRVDPCVPYTNASKETRPFVGILISVNGVNYYAPLTSPKPKHKTMKNNVDFIKINNGVWGAINLNNMIPVHQTCLSPVELAISDKDDKSEIDYKNLLTNQLSWCNANREQILHYAERLYKLITSGKADRKLAARCCNFKADEAEYLAYCAAHGQDAAQRTTRGSIIP